MHGFLTGTSLMSCHCQQRFFRDLPQILKIFVWIAANLFTCLKSKTRIISLSNLIVDSTQNLCVSLCLASVGRQFLKRSAGSPLVHSGRQSMKANFSQWNKNVIFLAQRTEYVASFREKSKHYGIPFE